MEQLSYEALRQRSYQGYLLDHAVERVLQFGEGNFLRGFADHFIDVMNERVDFQSKVVVVPPASAGKTGRINGQEGLYQLCLRGRLDGEIVDQRRVISCISRAVDVYDAYDAFLETAHNPDMCLIISNTTEAGIIYDPSCTPEDRPPASFPAKLTRLLWERYQAGLPGYLILPCELIADNGVVLRDYVLRHARDWALGDRFLQWLEEENTFCSTLVDRIVTGYPQEQADEMNKDFGLEDRLLDVAEPFGLWVIEGPETLSEQFPAPKAGLPVKFVPDHRPYKEQKVRILNGGHTAMVAAAYLAGHDIVRDSMADPNVRAYLEGTLFEEIIPTLSLPREDCEVFAWAVEERFDNPYIDHRLLDIALNSVSKWRARVLPSVESYLMRFHALPRRLTFSFAALCAFYSQRERNGKPYTVRDAQRVLEFFEEHWSEDVETLVSGFAAQKEFWGRDLSELTGFVPEAVCALERIRTQGMEAALAAYGKGEGI